jgi:hypothetical protein
VIFGGEVGAEGAFDDGADDVGGVGFGDNGFDVGGGELKSVENDCCAFGVDAIAGEGGDEEGDGDLDGFGVFEDGEIEFEGRYLGLICRGSAVDGGMVVDEGALALEEAGVEVTHIVSGEIGGFAADSVGLDVTAVCGFHLILLVGGTP